LLAGAALLAGIAVARAAGIHVKGVPKATWRKARQNAFDSDLSFKDYVIRVLDESKPYSSSFVGKLQP